MRAMSKSAPLDAPLSGPLGVCEGSWGLESASDGRLRCTELASGRVASGFRKARREGACCRVASGGGRLLLADEGPAHHQA